MSCARHLPFHVLRPERCRPVRTVPTYVPICRVVGGYARPHLPQIACAAANRICRYGLVL
jgi:hypothetical protein